MKRGYKSICFVCLLALVLLFPAQAEARGKKSAKQKTQKTYLTNENLKKAGADRCQKLMIVAHPDDETLWGGAHLLKKGYFVVCLTNRDSRTRRAEFTSILKATGNKGMILNYPDVVGGRRSNWKNHREAILADLKLLLSYKNWSLIATHNPQGEYGHIHHKMTNRMVTKQCEKLGLRNRLYYFGKYYRNHKITSMSHKIRHLPKNILGKKEKLLKKYRSQIKSVKTLSHMNPYENWIPANSWR